MTSHVGRRYTLALLLSFPPINNGGDYVEYTLLTTAIATHGTSEVRRGGIADVLRLLPEQAQIYELLEKDMLAGEEQVYAAFVRGPKGKVYALHFFGFSMLAAVPFKLLQWTGLPPFRCVQVLNLSAVFIVGLALFRLYSPAWKAGAGVALFRVCGDVLYWQWSSPSA